MLLAARARSLAQGGRSPEDQGRLVVYTSDQARSPCLAGVLHLFQGDLRRLPDGTPLTARSQWLELHFWPRRASCLVQQACVADYATATYYMSRGPRSKCLFSGSKPPID